MSNYKISIILKISGFLTQLKSHSLYNGSIRHIYEKMTKKSWCRITNKRFFRSILSSYLIFRLKLILTSFFFNPYFVEKKGVGIKICLEKPLIFWFIVNLYFDSVKLTPIFLSLFSSIWPILSKKIRYFKEYSDFFNFTPNFPVIFCIKMTYSVEKIGIYN